MRTGSIDSSGKERRMSVALRAPPAPDTVLVVDDDPFMVRLMQRALSQLGITGVSTCASAQTALYELDSAQGAPDLILLDLQMPDMDGVQFLRRLAELHYTGALILVSGEELHVLRSIDKLVRAHGIKSLGHLRKPFEPEVFAARIAKWAQANGDERRVSRKVCRPDDVRTAIATGALVNCYQPVVSVSR